MNGADWSNLACFAMGFAGVHQEKCIVFKLELGLGFVNPRKTRTPSTGCGVLFEPSYLHFLRVLMHFAILKNVQWFWSYKICRFTLVPIVKTQYFNNKPLLFLDIWYSNSYIVYIHSSESDC